MSSPKPQRKFSRSKRKPVRFGVHYSNPTRVPDEDEVEDSDGDDFDRLANELGEMSLTDSESEDERLSDISTSEEYDEDEDSDEDESHDDNMRDIDDDEVLFSAAVLRSSSPSSSSTPVASSSGRSSSSSSAAVTSSSSRSFARKHRQPASASLSSRKRRLSQPAVGSARKRKRVLRPKPVRDTSGIVVAVRSENFQVSLGKFSEHTVRSQTEPYYTQTEQQFILNFN